MTNPTNNQGVQPKAASVDHGGYGKCCGLGRVWVDDGQASNWYEGGSCENCRRVSAKVAERFTNNPTRPREELARIIAPRAFDSAQSRYDYDLRLRSLGKLDAWATFAFVGATWLGQIQDAYAAADEWLSRHPVKAASPEGEADPVPFSPQAVAMAVEWFGQNQTLELNYSYGDEGDIDDVKGWCVYRRGGNRNDQTWNLVGHGATPEAALISAMPIGAATKSEV